MKREDCDFPLELRDDQVPMVSFRKVSKSYGTLSVLDELDLDVATGEMVSIIGPSGSGKTTVLRMLMALERVNGGVIYVDGKPLTHMNKDGELVPADERHLRKRRADIGMCFQHFNLFPHMTAIENCMEGPVQVLRLSKVEARERSEELLEMVGMMEKKDQHPSRLSGGQQQRVAIARALAMRPKVMLFDEVTSALDPEVLGEVTTVIRQPVGEHNLKLRMATHQMGLHGTSRIEYVSFMTGKLRNRECRRISSAIREGSECDNSRARSGKRLKVPDFAGVRFAYGPPRAENPDAYITHHGKVTFNVQIRR